jgi:hypothetical protein
MSATTTDPTVAPARAPLSPGVAPHLAARIAGIGYLLIFGLAIFANFMVREGLIVTGDPAATAANITGSPGLFRAGFAAFLVVFLLDIVLAWALHVVFRSVNPDLSLLAAWSRLVYTAFLGVALVFHLQALRLLEDAHLAALGAEQAQAQALLALESFNDTWLVGLAAFGIHLVLLGVLVIRSGWAPRLLGVLLAIAGLAYVTDTLAQTLLPDYQAVAPVLLAIVAVPSMVGEGWLGLWLLLTRRFAR